eukprot:3210171-Prymnesium_polylepis.1
MRRVTWLLLRTGSASGADRVCSRPQSAAGLLAFARKHLLRQPTIAPPLPSTGGATDQAEAVAWFRYFDESGEQTLDEDGLGISGLLTREQLVRGFSKTLQGGSHSDLAQIRRVTFDVWREEDSNSAGAITESMFVARLQLALDGCVACGLHPHDGHATPVVSGAVISGPEGGEAPVQVVSGEVVDVAGGRHDRGSMRTGSLVAHRL